MLKNSGHIAQIFLAFAAGWYVHGWISAKPEVDQQSFFERSPDISSSISADADVPPTPISGNMPISAALASQVISLLEAGSLNEALRIVQNEKVVFSALQIEQYGLKLVDFFSDKDPGEYYQRPAIRQLVSILLQLDPHSPAAQYFSVIRLAKDQPQLALAGLDELASYYQQQVSQLHLQILEDWLLADVLHHLIDKRDWRGLESWYQLLLARSSEPLEVHDQMSRVFAAADRPFESSRALESIARASGLNTEQLALQRRNLNIIESSSVAAVEMMKVGQHFIAPVLIDGQFPASLLLDTGASISSLDQNFSDQIGLNASGEKILLGTAGGQVEADLMNLGSMSLGGSSVFGLQVARIDFGGRYQGLLGMDVLGEFEFYIDQQRSILYLRRPSSSSSHDAFFIR